jgi:hypothetical protein
MAIGKVIRAVLALPDPVVAEKHFEIRGEWQPDRSAVISFYRQTPSGPVFEFSITLTREQADKLDGATLVQRTD